MRGMQPLAGQVVRSNSSAVGHKRLRIYALLFLLSVIGYIDRISISIGAKPIAQEFHLSPVAMGYLLSAFFWTYALCLIPIGIVADRWGARKTIAASIALWSVMTAAAAFAAGLPSLLLTRLGLGAGEAAVFPAGGRVMREWTPANERGLAATAFVAGSYAGPAFGAALLSWVVTEFGWRGGFYVSGALGLTYLALWLAVYRPPEDATWLDPSERAKILGERNPGRISGAPPIKPMSVPGLLRSKALWGLALAHGCGIYSQYLYLTWLPTYLVTVRGMTLLGAGMYTTVPYLVAAAFNIVLGRISDRRLDPAAARRGQRRNLMAGLKLVSAVVLFVPFVQSTAAVMILLTISLSTLSGAIALHFALLHDLLQNEANAGKASGIVALGGNIFGLLAPIVTGYIIAGTGSYNWAFGVAGILLILGAGLLIVLARAPIDGPVCPPIWA
jgi:MFS family permease